MLTLFREQPRAFYMIFMLELWERFGFYTVQGILTLFFVRYLGYSDSEAYYTFGAFSALVYGMVVLGGYLGDKIIGTKRAITLGLVVLTLGYTFLAFATRQTVFLALGLVCVGNGLFKANPSNLLSKCYAPNDPRLHGGFTLYYMAINLGSMVALVIGPSVASAYGYGYAYFIAALGLLLGLVNYWYQYQVVAHVNMPADQKRIQATTWLGVVGMITGLTFAAAYLLQHIVVAQRILWLVSSVALLMYFVYMSREKKISAMRMVVALFLMVEAIVFFTLYQQMPTSLNLFAVNNVDANVLGIAIDPQSFQALNPIWIVLMSPVLAMVYRNFNQRGIHFTVPYKFALGMTMCGLSFFMLYFTRFFCNEMGMVSSWWLVFSYLFQSVGELLVSALGVAMVAELVPSSIVGFVMGMWFLTSAVAGFTGAFVATFTAIPEHIKPGVDSLLIYSDVFAAIGLVTFAIAGLMWLLAPRLSRFIRSPDDDLQPKMAEEEIIISCKELPA